MAQKRTAKEAFGRAKGQLSAVAAAKLARQKVAQPEIPAEDVQSQPEELAVSIAEQTYDGHHDESSAPANVPNEDVPDENVSASAPPRRPAVPLSSWKRTEQSVASEDPEGLSLRLGVDETITCVGVYDLEVYNGIATVYGALLRPVSGSVRVFAPSTHALPQVQARTDATLIRIKNADSSLRKLDDLSPLFRNLWAEGEQHDRSFALLRSSADDVLQRSLSPVGIDRDWDVVLRTISAKVMLETLKPRIMAVGAKASGKSTFNRILCNHTRSWTSIGKCLYLDLDPGQPEFGTPGQVSLVVVKAPILGPPYTHLAGPRSTEYQLVRSHTIAATTFKHDPDHYIACAQDLVKYAAPDLPLVVNGCGWISGLGASTITKLTQALSITDKVLFEPLDNELIELSQTERTLDLYRLPRHSPRPSPRTPAEQRAMQSMAYFHHRTARGENFPRYSGRPINQVRPYTITYAGTDRDVLAILSYGQAPKPEFLAEVLDGSIVAITVVDPDYASSLNENIGSTSQNIHYLLPSANGTDRTLDPAHSHCVGLALIRSIDTENQELQLVTPMSNTEIDKLLGKAVVLVRGSFDAPEWAYLEDVYANREEISDATDVDDRPWVNKREMVGIEGAVWRLRHPPLAPGK